MKLTGENRRTRGKTCPSASLSTTNPTRIDPGSNPDLRGGRPAANRLSHGAAQKSCSYCDLSKNVIHLNYINLQSLPHSEHFHTPVQTPSD
jgi:hypothetical protein